MSNPLRIIFTTTEENTKQDLNTIMQELVSEIKSDIQNS